MTRSSKLYNLTCKFLSTWQFSQNRSHFTKDESSAKFHLDLDLRISFLTDISSGILNELQKRPDFSVIVFCGIKFFPNLGLLAHLWILHDLKEYNEKVLESQFSSSTLLLFMLRRKAMKRVQEYWAFFQILNFIGKNLLFSWRF